MADISTRESEFKRQIQAIGGTLYTQEMLTRFFLYWSETDRAKKPKMRWEKEKTWHTGRRLALWARNNYDGIQCFLNDAQKTIAQKRHAFAVSLEPFLPKYGKETLNAFFAYWAMPENKPVPQMLRWEGEEFWSLDTKLNQWVTKNEATNRF
jgi:hypothetical protein